MAQTINIANIKIGMDVDELKKSGQFTRNELASLTRTMKASEPASEKLARDLALLDRAFAAGGVSAKRYAEAVEHLKKKHLDASSATTQHTTAAESLKSLAATYVGLGAAAAGIKKSIQLAAELETNKIAFEVMTGSAGKAEQMLNQFKQLDVRSPIAYGDFATAGKTLLQFGMQAEAVPATLERLSAISLGNTAQFQSLALAFGQVQANGRLMGGEVLQMINAGFNPLKEISRTTGISMVDLKKAMEAGGISAQMVADAFRTATEAGGLFYGMNEKLANSMAGQWSKLEGDIKAAAITLGTDLMPLLSQAMALVRENASGGGGDGERGIIGVNIKLIADAYASLFAGIKAGTDRMKKDFPSKGIMTFFTSWGAGLNAIHATLDYSQSIVQAEKERADAIMIAGLQEKEIAKKKDEELAIAKQLQAVEKARAAADKARTDELTKDIEYQKKITSQAQDLRKELDRLKFEGAAGKRVELRQHGMKAIDIQRLEALNLEIEKQQQLNALKKSQDELQTQNRFLELKRQNIAFGDSELKQMATLEQETKRKYQEELAASNQIRKNILASRMPDRQKQTALQSEEKELQKRLQLVNASFTQGANLIAQKAMAGLQEEAMNLTVQMDPKEQFRRESAQLNFMKEQRMISEQTFNKKQMQLAQEYRQASGFLPNIAPSLKAGSVEAYKFLLEQTRKSQERDELKKLNQNMLAELKEANRQNATAPRLAFAR